MKISKFIQKSPIVPVLLVGRVIEGELRESLRSTHLSIWEALIIVALFFEDRQCRPTEVARLLQMNRSQLSQAISKLIDKDMIQRSIAEKDARGVHLSLRPSGRKSALEAIKAFNRVTDSIENEISEQSAEEIAEKLYRCLGRFQKNRP